MERIETLLFLAGNQEHRYVPCPEYGLFPAASIFSVESGASIRWELLRRLRQPTRIGIAAKTAAISRNQYKAWMDENGAEWRAKQLSSRVSAITARSTSGPLVTSQFPGAAWINLAEFLDVRKGSNALRTFVNRVLGEVMGGKGQEPRMAASL